MATAFFSGTNGMDPSSKLPWFPRNFSGRVRIDVCKGISSERKGRAFIAEVTVLTSNLPEVPMGNRRSWYQGIKEKDTSFAACIGFLYAALGLVPGRDQAKIDEIKKVQDDWLNKIIHDANPLQGTEVMLQTSNILTKAKTDFTLHNWSAAPPSAVL